MAAVALRSGATVAELTVEADGRSRAFSGVVVQYELFPTPSVGVSKQTYLVAWADPNGHEILSFWTSQDGVDFGSSQAPRFSIGSASLETSGADSLWLYHSGWAKLAPRATGESCQSWQRPSDSCRIVTVAAAASLDMRALPIVDGGFGTPSPTPHRLVVRPTQLRGVHITQACFGSICSISFP